jgi:hypothetical protein
MAEGVIMATIITVHGTFAHADILMADDHVGDIDDKQWWEPGSAFERDIRALVEGDNGALDVVPFEWSGANSECGRREAGAKLLTRMRELEAKKEPYCVIGHSHGGSVISAALLEGGSRRLPLDNLKRWITVGTPFVRMKKERWLFSRLDLMRKVVFVASMMLFLMFFVYLLAELVGRSPAMLLKDASPTTLAITGIMMSLPIIFSFLVLKYLDHRSMLIHRRVAAVRARTSFAGRWLSFAHSDDEAIQGLTFLPGAKLAFFDKSFAVSTLTLASVVALPLAYLAVINSPTAMVAIGDAVKNGFYAKQVPVEAANEIKALRNMRTGFGPAAPGMAAPTRNATRRDYAEKRKDIDRRFPGAVASADRVARFDARFFEVDGKPCTGGKLCGGGRDLRINSGLLLHVVTDELAHALGTDEPGSLADRWFVSLLLPAVLVPVIACLFALAIMLLIRAAATVVSRVTSSRLNDMTNTEVKRAAFGNDTQGEIAVGAADRPAWIERSPPRLHAAVADLVTTYSNGIATNSLAKFRRAIGQLASVEPKHTADTAITTYFTWKELVHSSYFDVPEFRKLVALAISRTEGFRPSAAFRSNADFARTAQWLAAIDPAPAPAAPAATPAPGRPGTVAATPARA